MARCVAALVVLGIIRASSASSASPNNPKVIVYANQNQVFNVAQSRANTTTTKYLGTFGSAHDCQQACLNFAGPARCWSFTWHGPGSSFGNFNQQCFAVTAPRWSPTPDAGATSGVVQWPCRDAKDCSLNGQCDAGTGACKCRPAWSGHRCETLNLVPATRGAGYRRVDGGHNTSSWGGAVLHDPVGGQWHMWAAEMTEHCGIGAWAQNSRVIHAVSDTPGGSYTRKDVTWEVFSHEPEVVRGDKGEYVMYFTAQLRSEHGACNCCQPGGVSKCDGSTGPKDCGGGGGGGVLRRRGPPHRLGDSDPSYMSWASSPDGPWSKPVQIFANYTGADTNFAPHIFADGSLVAIWREWTARGSRCYLATASDWRDPSTYAQHTAHGELWPDLGAAGTEDPFLYADPDDASKLHAIFHHMYGFDSATQWWLDALGGHAFSDDRGKTWTYTGVAYGNATSTTRGNVVDWAGGGSFRFTRRERPHLIFDADGRVSHLTTAAQYGLAQTPGGGANGDACYTLIQPVAQK